LEVLGYKPILFISKERKNGFVADVITTMGPFADGPLQTIFEKMTNLYEFFVKSKYFVNMIYIYNIQRNNF